MRTSHFRKSHSASRPGRPVLFFESQQHREAQASLFYAILQRRGFGLLVARPGLGKTCTLVRLLQLLEGQGEIAFLPHPYFDRATVLDSVLAALGLDVAASSSQNHRLFYEHLMKLHKAGKTCILMFDEAQELNRDTLEAIRMLSNFETPTEKLVQIVLAGQPRLADMLKQPDCEQIQQRINVVARLEPLVGRQVHDYVTHRLRVAGTSTNLFAPDALDAIASASGGVPRNVNTICFNSLTLAYSLDRRHVAGEDVAEVLRDLDLTLRDPPAFCDSGQAVQSNIQESPKSTPAVQETGNSFQVRVRCGRGWRPLLKIWEQFHL